MSIFIVSTTISGLYYLAPPKVVSMTEKTKPEMTIATALELIGKSYLRFILLALDTATRDLVSKYRTAQPTASPAQPAKPVQPRKTSTSYIG